MDLNEYQNKAAGTAFYPGRNATLSPDCQHGDMLKCSPIPFPGYVYTLLGLIGELTEMKEASINDLNNLVPTEEEKKASSLLLTKEVGDVFWYLSQFTMELGIPFSQIDQKIEWSVGGYGPHYNCGIICELIKKTIRDNAGKVTPQTKDKVLAELRIIYSYTVYLCRIHNINPNDVMEENIKKLTSRKNRGVLGGSGDER